MKKAEADGLPIRDSIKRLHQSLDRTQAVVWTLIVVQLIEVFLWAYGR